MLRGPQAEPGTSLPAAAARPRLRLGSQRGSAWGAAAAGSAGPTSEAAERGARSPASAEEPRPRRALAARGSLPSSRRPLRRAAAARALPGPEGKRERSNIPSGARASGSPALPARARVPPGGRPCPARGPPDAGERRRRAARPAPEPRAAAQPSTQEPSDVPAPTRRGHYYYFFFLGSSKFKACSHVLRIHPAFPQVPRIFLDINFRGPGNMSRGWVPPESPSGLGPQTRWAFPPRLLTVLYTLLQILPNHTPPTPIPPNVNVNPGVLPVFMPTHLPGSPESSQCFSGT